jgi:hypothetical protein
MVGQGFSHQGDATPRIGAMEESATELDVFADILWDAGVPEPHSEPESGHWTRPIWERLKARLERQSEALLDSRLVKSSSR